MANSHRTLTSVYRYYDLNDLLLYVGITSRGTRRQDEHNATKEWWKFVARQEVEHYPSRSEASDREKKLIRSYRPPFNRQHNPGHELARSAYLDLATDKGERSRNVHPVLTKYRGKKRMSMDIARIGGALVLRSRPDDSDLVQQLDVQSAVHGTLSTHGAKGARPKLDRAVAEDAQLVMHVSFARHSERIRRAEVLLRMPQQNGHLLTFKRIDLYAAGAGEGS